jgi:2-keto-4-pentenoate hydratase/2-oxohepta-3-ene-1,7-dioic acid hydratase in catechol pathway
MRLVCYGDDARPGVVVGDSVVDISPLLKARAHTPPEERMLDLIEHLPNLRTDIERLTASAERVPLGAVRLRAPVPRPGKIFAAVGNFLEYGARPVQPIDWFYKSPESVIGPDDTIVLPPHAARIFHYEAELGVVIGKRCKDVAEDEVDQVILGYTCFMDISARDLGRPRIASFFGKSFDTFGPMGPWVVTADEFGDPYVQVVRVTVNDDAPAEYPLDDMGQRVPALVAHASSVATLLPGDIIACGTNHQGLGAIQHGDVVTMEITGLGSFSVNVRDPLFRRWPRGVDTDMAARIRGVEAAQPQQGARA